MPRTRAPRKPRGLRAGDTVACTDGSLAADGIGPFTALTVARVHKDGTLDLLSPETGAQFLRRKPRSFTRA